MESFFCSYPPFKPDPKNPPQANFTRLCEFRGWTSAKSLARHRRAYCQALATENSKRKDQHWPFFARFPDFDYRGDVLLERESEGVDVNAQFRRLMEFKGWEAGCSQYYKAMKEFKNAKRGTSLKPGTRAAKAIPNSSPASRQLPKPQQNLTRAPSSPPKRMKPVRVSVQVILHGPGPDEDFDNEPTPLDEFFARWWPAFKHNPTRHPINEYERMARELMWNLPTYYEWYEPFYDATREEFRHQIFRPRQLTVRKDVLVEVGTTAQQVIEMQAVVVDEQKSNQNDLALKAFNRLCLILGKDKASTREDAMEVYIYHDPSYFLILENTNPAR